LQTFDLQQFPPGADMSMTGRFAPEAAVVPQPMIARTA
jgi:hypothetical protein